MPTTLVPVETLAAHLDDPSWVVVDCRYDLTDPEAGERAYEVAHVAGAAYAHLGRDLAGAKTGRNGRHPLPPVESMVATFGALGIDAARQVVAYDQDSGMFAARLWWMLRYLGHDAVAVLDGGFARWVAGGHATSAGRHRLPPRTFSGSPRTWMLVDASEMARRIGDASGRTVDARAPERYRGEHEPMDPVAGHIPGAVNHHYERNLAPDGTFLPADRLREHWLATIGDTPPAAVTLYCGSGVTACHDLLALEHAGLPQARLYAGSWSEWCSDPSRPVAR